MKRKQRTYEGLPVMDATDPVVLHITKADVQGAKKNDPAHCAAAVAGKREYKKEVRVFLTRTYVKEKTHWTRYINPERVTREIVSFDRGSTFVPGAYKVDAAPKAARLGAPRGVSSHPRTGHTNVRPRYVTAEVREFDRTQLGKNS